MNEIIVRTSKAEYLAGETVFGAVYVRIASPSAASGVRLKFFGYETYLYSNLRSHDPSLRERCLQSTQQYIKCDSIVIYKSEEPLAFGEYVLPFRKRLPQDLPGCFTKRSSSGPRWEVTVVYKVEAELIGLEVVMATQPIHIHQCVPREELHLEATAAAKIKRTFSHSLLTATVRIDKDVYYTEENLQLTIKFENSDKTQPDITSIIVKLQQEFVLVFHKTRSASAGGKKLFSHCQYPGFSPRVLDLDSSPSEVTDPQESWMEPDGHMTTLRTVKVLSREKVKLFHGVRNLILPLTSEVGRPLFPSVTGAHTFLLHWIEVAVQVKGTEVIKLHIPLPHIREQNSEWPAWVPDEWLPRCQLLPMEDHECSVPKDVLSSDAFSSLPCFQVP